MSARPELRAPAAAQTSVDELLRLASRAFTARQYPKSAELLAQARALAPQSLDVLQWTSRVAQRTGDWPLLRDAASAWRAQAPSAGEPMRLQARSLTELRAWSEAADLWGEVTARWTEDHEAWRELGRARGRAGQAGLAAEAFSRARALAGADAERLVRLAALAEDTGAIELAASIFNDAADLDHALVETALARLLSDGAVRAAAAALSTLDDGSDAYREDAHSLADTLVREAVHQERSGALVEAFRDYSAALLLSPGDSLVAQGRARMLRGLVEQAREQIGGRDLVGAEATCADILSCEPNSLHALALRAEAAAGAGPEEAARRLSALIEAGAGPELLVPVARAFDAADQGPQAARAWRAVLEVDPGHKEAARELGRQASRLLKAGRDAVAEGRLIDAWRALSAIPADARERADAERRLDQVGRSLLKQMRGAYKAGDYLTVVKDGQAATAILTDHLDAFRLLAKSAAKLREHATALDAWIRVGQLEAAAEATTQVAIARCYRALRNRDAAAAALDRALAAEPGHAEALRLRNEWGAPR